MPSFLHLDCRKNYYIIWMLIAWLSQPCAYGQQINPRFTNYTINNGLSQGLVYSITQDRQGFMWFGTQDGLDRFDGYEFTIFRHDPFDPASLSNNAVTALLTDTRGQLWAGTLKGGLDLYDPAHNRFIHFLINTSDSDKVTGSHIRSLTEDTKGNLWVGTFGNGIFEFTFSDSGKKKGIRLPENIIHYRHQPGNNSGLSSNYIHCVYADHEGRLWVSSTDTALQVAYLGRKELRFHTPGFTVLRVKRTVRNSDIQYDRGHGRITGNHVQIDGIYDFYEDRLHNLWIGKVDGLYLLKNKSDTLIYLDPLIVPLLKQGTILSICRGPAGEHELWLGAYKGLEIFNTKSWELQLIQNKPGDEKSLLKGVVLKVYKDRSGCMWMGSNSYGVSKYDFHSSLFSALAYYTADRQTNTGDLSILSFLDTKQGLLLGAYNGLWLADSNQGLLVNKNKGLQHINKNIPLIDDMLPADSGKVWLASGIGLILYDPREGKCVNYSPDIPAGGKMDNSIIKIYQGRHENLWVLTAHAFSDFNIRDKTFTNYYYSRKRISTVYSPPPGDIYRDDRGNFWLGSEEGLLYFDTRKKTFQYYVNHPADTSSLSLNAVESVVPDRKHPRKYLWVGTAGGGLDKFDILNKKFIHFTIKDGLPNNFIHGILPDDEGFFWISTNKGITKFNPVNGTFHNYDVREGLQSNEFNPGAYYKNKKGVLFFGGARGFNEFYPDSIKSSLYIPPVVFTGFRLLNRSVTAGDKNSPLKQPIEQTHHITLSYKDNIFSLLAAALDYSEPDKNRYAYRLENFNDNWINLGHDRLITLSNLNPGHYILQVRASNSDGVWNKKGASLAVDIIPPWWRTVWAYIAYTFIALVLVWLIRREGVNRMRLKNKLAMEHLAADNLKEIDHLKSRFFANISHEFRTPLTLILGPLEDFLRSGEVSNLTNFAPEMHRNSRRLLQLINQLLDLSKLDTNNYRIKAEREGIISFIKQIIHSFSSLARRKSIDLKLAIDTCLENKLIHGIIHFYFDEDIIEKILTNLLSNAFKFTPPEGTVIVSLSLPENQKNMLELKVEDNGVGIPVEKLPYVFDRFYQADDPNLKQQEGSGIGLALVRELVKLHSGEITAGSQQGKGTTICCYLPLDKKTLSGTGKPDWRKMENKGPLELTTEEIPVNEGAVPANEGTPMILLVEDQQDVRKYIREKLQAAYTVIEAENGKEGWAKATAEIPDLVISDVMMPVMDGFELCKEIKADDRTSHIPVILLTARAEDSDRMAGLETGADAYLIKPFNSQELRIRIHHLIRVRQKMRVKFSNQLVVKPSEISVTSRDRLFVEKALSVVEDHLSDPRFSVDQLAAEMNMSVSQMNRKLKAVINQTTQHFIRSIRMQRALELLKGGGLAVSEAAWKTGFEDPGYFTKVFKQQFGCLPSESEKFPGNA